MHVCMCGTGFAKRSLLTVRRSFFDRHFHSRMPLSFHAFAPLDALDALPCV
jgi:hypothetical protein